MNTAATHNCIPVKYSIRSGHQIAVHESNGQMFLYGGYSKVKEPGRKSEGKVHNDMWVLNLQPLSTGGTPAWDRSVAHVQLLTLLVHIYFKYVCDGNSRGAMSVWHMPHTAQFKKVANGSVMFGVALLLVLQHYHNCCHCYCYSCY
jgi:Kelch motif